MSLYFIQPLTTQRLFSSRKLSMFLGELVLKPFFKIAIGSGQFWWGLCAKMKSVCSYNKLDKASHAESHY